MKKYEIVSKNKTSLIINAPNKLIAQKIARQKGFKLAQIKELENQGFTLRKKLKSLNLTLLFKELSLLLEAGISLQLALNELYQNSENKDIKRLINRLIVALKSGQNLSSAFENSGFAFDKSELALIKMGENTGDLSFVFSRLSNWREKKLNNTKRLKKALSYPLFVFCTLVIAFCALMFFVVPQFQGIFDDFAIELPLITQIMLQIYEFLAHSYEIMLILLGIFALLCFVLHKNFSFVVDKLILKLPLLGRLIFYHQSTQFFLVFSMLIKSGISVSKALILAKSSFANTFLAKKCEKINEFCEQGLGLDEAFKKVKIFDSLTVGMLAVAMKSAKLDVMSEKISQFYEAKSEDLMESFLRILEPLLTFFVAILVLFLALGIFLPMWELNQSIQF